MKNQAMVDSKAQTEAQQAMLAITLKMALSEPGAPTPGQLAEACGGISEQSISNWKRTGKISKTNLAIVAQMTGWSMQRLLTGVDDAGAEHAQGVEGLTRDDKTGRIMIDGHVITAEEVALIKAHRDVLPEDQGDATTALFAKAQEARKYRDHFQAVTGAPAAIGDHKLVKIKAANKQRGQLINDAAVPTKPSAKKVSR